MIVQWGIRPPLFEIAFEASLCRFVNGDKAALSEFGISNYQSVRRDVAVAQVNGFGSAKSRACQQREEGAVGLAAQRVASQLECRLHELLNVFAGHDIWDGTWPFLATKDSCRHFVARIFDPGETRETNYLTKPARTLMNRSRQFSPFNGRFAANVVLSSCVGESGEVEQTVAL